MNVLVTGGAGFVGSHLVERLVSLGDTVAVVDDLSTGKLENLDAVRDRIAFEEIDVTSFWDLNRAAIGADVIVHCAARLGVEAVLNDPTAQFENVQGIQNVLSVAERQGCKVLFTSTSSVYGCQTPPYREDMSLVLRPDRMSSYSCAKLMGEYLAQSFNDVRQVPTCIVRLFNMSGPRAATSGPYSFVLQRFVKAALEGSDLVVYGDGSQTRSFTYVKDGARSLERLLHCPEAFDGRPINIGSSEEISILHLARQVRSITGSSSQIVFKPYREVHPNFTDYQRRQPDCGRLANLISYRPTTGLEGIVRMTAESLERQKETA